MSEARIPRRSYELDTVMTELATMRRALEARLDEIKQFFALSPGRGVDWWQAYINYLQTSVWFSKRKQVELRARDICETPGCTRRVAHIHHLRYPPYSPGSPDWIIDEKLDDLMAVCIKCHEARHPHH
jgi:hypothetical protein